MTDEISNKTPVSVITGFLGAGKTTLLSNLLQNNDGKKYAIIVNEFGEIGIDNDIMVGADEEIFELNNGCVCCNVRGDLIRILGALFKRKNAFDAILVETTGLANPAPVAQTFFADDDIARRSYLDGIVTLVDALNIGKNLDEFEEATNQIAFADVIILNKISEVSKGELAEIRARIKAINSGAKIIETNHSQINADEIFNLHSYEGDRDDLIDNYFAEEKHDHHHDDHHHCHDANCTHEHHHEHHHHDHHIEQSGVRALALQSDKPFIEEKFLSFLNAYVSNLGEATLRFKGIVRFFGKDTAFVFNGVHMMVDADFRPEKPVDDNFVSRLVFIGKQLPEDLIRAELMKCS